ncbi:MAG: tetratricopeptide repeat protein, partial [Armatimonadetes bacterium]|nr:tetratricopeptide repeat protein [Armatimonadota bacterium]
PFREKIAVEMVGQEVTYQAFDEDRGSDEARQAEAADEAMLRAFEFIPAEFPFRSLTNAVSTQDIVGYYDYGRHALFIVKGAESHREEVEATCVHELQHALQDQHFGAMWSRHEDAMNESPDDAVAMAALSEGEARWVETAWNYRRMDRDLAAEPPPARYFMSWLAATATWVGGVKIPVILQQREQFPYAYGPLFVHALRSLGSWMPVESAWRRPPRTTLEVMAPARYLRGQVDPWRLRFPKRLGPRTSEGTLGAFHLQVLLNTRLGTSPAHNALALRWDGDRFAVTGPGELLWQSRWESPQAAARAEKLLRKAYPTDYVERRGSAVLLVRGRPALRAIGWEASAWRASRMPDVPDPEIAEPPGQPSLDHVSAARALKTGAQKREEKQPTAALPWLKRATEAAPRNADAWFERGNAHSDLGQYADAIACYSRCLKRNPRDADALYNRGLAYQEMDRFEPALRDFEAVLRRQPKEPDAMLARAECLASLGRNAEALVAYGQASTRKPLDGTATRDLAYVLDALGRPSEARTAASKAVQFAPEDLNARLLRARLAMKAGDLLAAERDYTFAVQAHDPDDDDYSEYVGRARLRLRAGRPLEALRDVREALR